VATTNNPTYGTNVLKTWVLPLSNLSGDTFAYTLTDLPANANGLSAKAGWNLRKKLPITPGGLTTAEFTGAGLLKGGDLIHTPASTDNKVTFLDYSFLGSNLFILHPDLGADITGDGLVDLDDYSILSVNWFIGGDPE
jgi:hypothetical protein